VTKAALWSYFERRRIPTLAIGPGVTVPRRFSDPAAEHLATRQAAGLFDFSFMGCAEIAGVEACDYLDYLQTRNLAGLKPGRIAYTLLLHEDGSVLTDATVWNLGEGRFALFVSRREDLAHLARLATGYSATVVDRSTDHAVLALQGPEAGRILLECLAPEALPPVAYYGFASIALGHGHGWLARIGYSGESGYELIVPRDAAQALWERLVAAGKPFRLAECGFEAADTLRIEAGHLLFARELAAPVSPSELALERLVEPYGRKFHGGAALRKVPRKRLVGLLPYSRGSLTREQLTLVAGQPPPRLREGAAVVTSTCFSPIFHAYLALGFVGPGDHYPGTRVTLGEELYARVARLPFYDPAKLLARRAN